MGVSTYIDIVRDGKKVGSYDLDDSGYYLRVGLEALGLDGEGIVHGVGGPDGVDAEEGATEGIVGQLAPDQVRAFWERLSPVTVEQFVASLRNSGRVNGDEEEEEYYTMYFAELKKAYGAAVRENAGMTVFWY